MEPSQIAASSESEDEERTRLGAWTRVYHVFLNHHWPEVKYTLASTIYFWLRDKGWNVFFDKTEFQPGHELLHATKDAIRTSSVHIAIISPRYAESPWCLDELCLMLESGAKIIPVFYHVPPSDLERLEKGKGSFANAFQKLENKVDGEENIRYDTERLQRWKKALKQICIFSGLELDSKDFKGDEGELVETIGNLVLKHITKAEKKEDKKAEKNEEKKPEKKPAAEKKADAPPTRVYDVFINHRGPDAKNTLASHIYHRLRDKGLNVFFDKWEFRPGEKLPSRIEGAIGTSSVHIAILSPRYAESHWCLEELSLMVESGAKIIPVFYNVSPGDLMLLKKREGKYAQDFAALENKEDNNVKRHDGKKLEKWKQALIELSKISVLVLESNIEEGKLVQTLCYHVMEHVRMERKKTANDFAGLDEAVSDFEDFLKQSQSTKIVGIVGTAGSGKTTLAEEYFYRQRKKFDKFSFLSGIRKAYCRLEVFQQQLLSDITDHRWVIITNKREGKEILVDRIDCLRRQGSTKLLIVIDDVDDQNQLDALMVRGDILGSGSLIIVTSRDKTVLKLSGISLHYEMKPLGMMDARELFCRHAFHQPTAMGGFESLVEAALSKCGGLPLLLKLIGGNLHLYGMNNKDYCEDELEMISEIPKVFKDTYAALGEEERNVFLDIACFFVGMERNSAMRIWAGSGWRGSRALQKLQCMCLVQIDENNCLRMDDYLRDFGRHMADLELQTRTHLPCRMWRPDHARSFLKEVLPVPEHTLIRVIIDAARSHERFGKQKACTLDFSLKIELLDVNGDFYTVNIPNRLRDLVWFRWKNCPHTSIPTFEMNNLRVLELVKGGFKTFWDPAFQLPAQLREIKVVKCSKLEAIPENIESLKLLEKMTLNGSICLKTLPQEFCKLKALTHLELRQCEGLTSLPDDFGQLTNLQHIDCSDCQKLSILPLSFGQLKKLKYLNLQNCRELMIQPQIFREITTLEQLNFENCEKLRRLPTQTTLQGSLRKLNLLGTNLEELPDDICDDSLANLQLLTIGSPLLRSIPSALGHLRSLSELVLFNCEGLIPCPQSIGNLSLSHTSQMQTREEAMDIKRVYIYYRSDV